MCLKHIIFQIQERKEAVHGIALLRVMPTANVICVTSCQVCRERREIEMVHIFFLLLRVADARINERRLWRRKWEPRHVPELETFSTLEPKREIHFFSLFFQSLVRRARSVFGSRMTGLRLHFRYP